MSERPTVEEAEVGRALVAQHQEAARITGRTYAETLFAIVDGREPTGDWFDARCRDLGNGFVSMYRARPDSSIFSDAFLRLIIETASRAMFVRLGELLDAAPAPAAAPKPADVIKNEDPAVVAEAQAFLDEKAEAARNLGTLIADRMFLMKDTCPNEEIVAVYDSLRSGIMDAFKSSNAQGDVEYFPPEFIEGHFRIADEALTERLRTLRLTSSNAEAAEGEDQRADH